MFSPFETFLILSCKPLYWSQISNFLQNSLWIIKTIHSGVEHQRLLSENSKYRSCFYIYSEKNAFLDNIWHSLRDQWSKYVAVFFIYAGVVSVLILKLNTERNEKYLTCIIFFKFSFVMVLFNICLVNHSNSEEPLESLFSAKNK